MNPHWLYFLFSPSPSFIVVALAWFCKFTFSHFPTPPFIIQRPGSMPDDKKKRVHHLQFKNVLYRVFGSDWALRNLYWSHVAHAANFRFFVTSPEHVAVLCCKVRKLDNVKFDRGKILKMCLFFSRFYIFSVVFDKWSLFSHIFWIKLATRGVKVCIWK